MKKLPIDLITINTINSSTALKTLDFCNQFFKFNNSIVVTKEIVNYKDYINVTVDDINSINDYNNFCLKLNKIIKSDFCLVVQDDGHIVNPDKWEDSFLNFDYIGAPWPSSKSWIKRFKKLGQNDYRKIKENFKLNRVGNGGFSLRSKKFLEYSSTFQNTNNISEDIFLCILNYSTAKFSDIQFADFNTAMKFSYETPLKGFNKKRENSKGKFEFDQFGWHGERFTNSTELLNLKFR